MHSVEKEVFNIIKKEAEIHPEQNIKEILVNLKNKYEISLIKKQLGIFKLIDRAALKIKPELHKEIRSLLIDSANSIKQGNTNFGRKKLINQIETILKEYPNTASKENLIRIAGKLPTSYEDVEAFIVKYAKEKYNAESIAIRLLSYSMGTIEHIHPSLNGSSGPNHLYNYVPECMRCNSFRSNKPMIYQLEEHPEMFINAQRLYDRLIDFANHNKLNKMYIIKLYKALYQESEGMLDLDYSRLNMNSEHLAELKRPFAYPINPQKPNPQTLKPLPIPKPISFDDINIENTTLSESEKITKYTDVKIETPKHYKSVNTSSPVLSKHKRKVMLAAEKRVNESGSKTAEHAPKKKPIKRKSEHKGLIKRSGGKK